MIFIQKLEPPPQQCVIPLNIEITGTEEGKGFEGNIMD